MEISDVRVRLVEDANERLKAVCSITFDDIFVVRDVKIVEGTNGLFVAMPSRKLTAGCPRCRGQNHLRARHCNECGSKLPAPRIPSDGKGREKAHRDIAHPITPEFRETLQKRVLEAYRLECEKLPDEDYDDAEATVEESQSEFDDQGPDEGDDEGTDDGDDRVTGYGALIADLKGGGRSSDRSSREPRERRDDSRGGDRRRRRRNGRSDERDRRREERPQDEDRAVASESADDQWKSDEAPAERETPAPVAVETNESSDEDGFGAGLLDSPRPERLPPRSQAEDREAEPPPAVDEPPEATSTPPAEPDDDEDAAFGAGIL